jgi:outer membrane protein TolC
MKRALLLLLAATQVAYADRGAKAVRDEPRPRTRGPDLAAFEADLEAVFVTDGLTADDAARRAVKASPQLRRRGAAVDEASADVARAKLSYIPLFVGSATYTRLSPIDPVVLPLGPQQFVIPFFEDSYALDGRVVVNLSDYLTRDGDLVDGASLARDAARLAKQASAAGIAEQTRETYYEWVRAQLQVLVAKRQLIQVKSTLEQVKSLVEVQRASTADLLRVESQQAQALQLLHRLESAVTVRARQLRLAIGADGEEDLAIGEDIRQDFEIEKAELDELETRARKHRPELASVATGIRAKEAERSAEAADLAPHLSAFAAAELANPNPRVFPQQDKFKLTWAIGAQVTWVINESLAGNAQRDKLAAQADELRSDRASLEQQVELEVLGASEAVTLATQALDTTRQGIEAAEEGYRVRKDLFGAGRATVVEMVDAENELARARIAALDARIDLRIAAAKLAYALGASGSGPRAGPLGSVTRGR